MTKAQLQEELKQSMLARNSEKTSTLRMLLSAIGYLEIEKGGAGYTASEEDVQTAIQKQVKQHRDSIEQYETAGRSELADKEKKELLLLQAYLPAQMSEEEIKTLVQKVISETGAASVQDLGKVMGILMPQTKGKADGGLVNKIVREILPS